MNFLQSAKNNLISTGHAIGERVTPILKESLFEEKGVLTPEEFIAAGDQLVRTSPTWKWCAGDSKKRRDYLPKEKQFLMTSNVPCSQRIAALNDFEEREELLENDWIATDMDKTRSIKRDESNDVIDSEGNINSKVKSKPQPIKVKEQSVDDFIDINDLIDEDLTDTLQDMSVNGNIIKSRSYSLSITYDKYYQTPRVFLEGFNAELQPLSEEEVFEDIMQDYKNKTVTLEKHPHLVSNRLQASIHPCRHAKVMKKIIDRLKEGGKEADSKQYLFIFLKFIQSVIPTVDYDYTISVTAK